MANEWNGILDVLEHAGRLKQLLRQGWVDRGVYDPESVADHCYRLAVMVLLLGERAESVNLGRALTLALVHDLPESIAGDATPFDQALNEAEAEREAIFRQPPAYSSEADRAKYAAESEAMDEITAGLSAELKNVLLGAWNEYEAGQTPEARLVRQADKLESWLQALEYRQKQPGLVIESFSIGTEQAVTDPALRGLLDAIRERFGGTEPK